MPSSLLQKSPLKETQAGQAPFAPAIEYISSAHLRPLLQRVQRPGRYVGGEFGIPSKDPASTQVRVLLSYPDTYELGMSNEGLRILYDCINRDPDLMADRAFLPWPDFQKEMEAADLSLYSLDHFMTAASFDLWGFNTAHELHYTNLCYALDLARIPILRHERRTCDPLIITGGTAISNPFPLFDFMDAIFLGDGEEGIIDICNIIAAGKRAARSRSEILEDLREVEGLILPGLYQIHDHGLDAYPVYSGPVVKKRNYRSRSFSALQYTLVPNITITQDRTVVEVARGCGQGCRFCHAGFWKRPVRNGEVSALIHTAGEMLKKTGHNSIALHSLSLADYPWLEELVIGMAQAYGSRGVSLSLPSLRVQVKTIPVLEMTSQIRRSNVTFALEAGSELQRERIRKKSSEENLHYLIRQIYARGWDLVKVYFMIGLPYKDGHEIREISQALNALGRIAEECGQRKKVNITVSLFVPKPFTTFQWEKQQTPDYFQTALKELNSQLKSRRVRLKGPGPEMPYVEGLLSRSDHRVGQWVLKAYRRGARFDSWDDQFSPELWRELCNEIPEPLRRLWLEQKAPETLLPWHNVIEGVKAELLYRDHQRYESVNESNMKPPHPQALQPSDFPVELLQPVQIPNEKFQTAKILAIHYSRGGPLIYVSHLETAEILRRACRRIDLPMTFSQGYNKQEKLHFFDTLPVYFYSERESIYVELYTPIDLEEKTSALAHNLPQGLSLLGLELLAALPDTSQLLRKKRYRLDFMEPALARQCHSRLLSCPGDWEYERPIRPKAKRSEKTQKKAKTRRQLGAAIGELSWESKGDSFSLELAHPSTGAISMKDLLIHYLNLKPELWNVAVSITRLA